MRSATGLFVDGSKKAWAPCGIDDHAFLDRYQAGDGEGAAVAGLRASDTGSSLNIVAPRIPDATDTSVHIADSTGPIVHGDTISAPLGIPTRGLQYTET